MKRFFVAAVALASTISAMAAPSLNCELGPANKTFGQSQWLVYGCDDKHSIVVVSAPGSPAMPFYFFFSYEGGKYGLNGEGTGSKAATDAAYAELSKLSNEEIAKLYAEAAKISKR